MTMQKLKLMLNEAQWTAKQSVSSGQPLQLVICRITLWCSNAESVGEERRRVITALVLNLGRVLMLAEEGTTLAAS